MLGMSVRSVAWLAATVALLGATGAAHAATTTQTPPTQAAAATAVKPMDFTVRAETSPLVAGAQVLKWDAAKGKWGLTFNLQQPETREPTLNDVQAGAYYKITPALRVGGAFAFGSQTVVPGPKPNTPDNTQPRVQLETKFKF